VHLSRANPIAGTEHIPAPESGFADLSAESSADWAVNSWDRNSG